jgi:hypothetical protein
MLLPMKNRNRRELEKYWAKEAAKKAKQAQKAATGKPEKSPPAAAPAKDAQPS